MIYAGWFTGGGQSNAYNNVQFRGKEVVSVRRLKPHILTTKEFVTVKFKDGSKLIREGSKNDVKQSLGFDVWKTKRDQNPLTANDIGDYVAYRNPSTGYSRNAKSSLDIKDTYIDPTGKAFKFVNFQPVPVNPNFITFYSLIP
jgi:hypothetical protein